MVIWATFNRPFITCTLPSLLTAGPCSSLAIPPVFVSFARGNVTVNACRDSRCWRRLIFQRCFAQLLDRIDRVSVFNYIHYSFYRARFSIKEFRSVSFLFSQKQREFPRNSLFLPSRFYYTLRLHFYLSQHKFGIRYVVNLNVYLIVIFYLKNQDTSFSTKVVRPIN